MDNKICSFIVVITAIIYMYTSFFNKAIPPLKERHFVAPGWEKVANIFNESFVSGRERGGSFAIYHEGKLVFNAVGGYADEAAKVPYSDDTLVQIYSTTKAIAAVVIANLVDRGLLDYKSPVAKYWPEFAQNGKERVTVEQLISHQAGLVSTDTPVHFRDMLENPDRLGQILAQQKPLWKLGTGCGYHSLSLGLYVDQLIRRVDPKKRSMAQLFEDEFASVFDLDIFIGLPKSENYRTAVSYPGSLISLNFLKAYKSWSLWLNVIFRPDSLGAKATMGIMDSEFSFNNPWIREVGQPAVNGFATARSVAKFFGILANGGKHTGKTMLSEKRIKQLQEPVISGNDLTLNLPVTYGRGVLLLPTPSGKYMFGTPGLGGQMGYADVENKLAWAHLTNYHGFHFTDDPRYVALTDAMYEALHDIKAKTKPST